MTKLEKVIKGLTDCSSRDYVGCALCDWYDEETGECFSRLAKDALELLKDRQWVSVKDRLPEHEGDYLVTDGHVVPWKCRLMILAGVKGWVDSVLKPEVEYWMPFPPLPEPPKEGDGE